MLAAFMLFLAPNARAKDLLPQVPIDKKAHALLSYGLTYTASTVLYKLGVPYPELWAGLAVGTAGAYKELVYDEHGDKNDMAANMVGIGLAVGMSYTLRF